MPIAPSLRIAHLSRRMAWVVTAAFWLVIPGIVLYVLLLPEQLPYHAGVAMAGFTPRPLPPLVAGAVMAALGVVSIPILWGLWELKNLFEGYTRGEIFTVEAARNLRRFGYALMVSAAKTGVGSVLLSAALSIDVQEGRKALVLSFSSDDLALLLIGAILLVISKVMEEASRVAEENAGFV